MRSLILMLFLSGGVLCAQTSLTVVRGTVSNSISGDKIPICSVIVDQGRYTAVTDSLGRYSVRVPSGKYSIEFRRIGYSKVNKTVLVKDAELVLNLSLDPKDIRSREVTVRAGREAPSIVVQKLDAKDLEKMPDIYSDPLRSVQILSGVSTNNELTSGYNVRGGTFDENLIYLNGYEIYRPVLIRQGTEESQSIVNPDLVKDMKFSNGAFPASYGDKMSSALEVNYPSADNGGFRGSLRADLMNMGLSFVQGGEHFSSASGFRYAYPGMFLNQMQTKGSYRPSFSDAQYFGCFRPDSLNSIELFLLYADNKYDVTPNNWVGNFRSDRMTGLASQVELDYSGNKYYRSITGLYALKYCRTLGEKSFFNISFDHFHSSEKENSDLSSEIYYSPDAESPDQDREYVKNRHEKTDDRMLLNSYRLQGRVQMESGISSFRLGGEMKYAELSDQKYEFSSESGPLSLQPEPLTLASDRKYYLRSSALYAQDKLNLSKALQLEFGIRGLSYGYTDELLLSPRAGLMFFAGSKHVFSFRWGYYYQPPFFNEFDGTDIDTKKLKSQRSIHYLFGWEWLKSEGLSFQLQVYYKKLDRLIPFYYDDLKMIYRGTNSNEGYAKGFDLMLKGKVFGTDRADSWFGYSYLDTRERPSGSGPWRRRLMDQTHSIQIFLQDRMPKHQNWQSHLRFLAGSGFLTNNRVVVTDPATGKSELKVDMDHPDEYSLYLRVDMGMSASFEIGKRYRLLLITELLNVFDRRNCAGYEYQMVFPDIKGAVRIPRNLSPRFLNFKIQFSF